MTEHPRTAPPLEVQRELAAKRRSRTRGAWQARREATKARQDANLERIRRERHVSLLDLVDRLLDGGVVIHGDITLAVADVDLLYVGLRAMVSSVETLERELGLTPSLRGTSLNASAL